MGVMKAVGEAVSGAFTLRFTDENACALSIMVHSRLSIDFALSCQIRKNLVRPYGFSVFAMSN